MSSPDYNYSIFKRTVPLMGSLFKIYDEQDMGVPPAYVLLNIMGQ